MAEDPSVESLLWEAQAAASKPITFKDLKPHERAMVKALGRVGALNCMTDVEMVSGFRNVLAYLESQLALANQRRGTMP